MAIRYVPALSIRIDQSFGSADGDALVDQVELWLSLAEWVQKTGNRAGAYLRFNILDFISLGFVWTINGEQFILGPAGTGQNSVPYAGSAPGDSVQNFINLAETINTVPGCGFRAVNAGLMTPSGGVVTTNGPASMGVDIEAITSGTAGNRKMVAPGTSATTAWIPYLGSSGTTAQRPTGGGGFRLESLPTSEFQRMRLRLLGEATDASDIANIRACSADETFTGVAVTPTIGLTYRLLANRYQYYLFNPGATSNFLFGMCPAIPTFMAPLRISGATNADPIVVTTAGDHGLETGDEVVIANALETRLVTNVDGAPSLHGLEQIRPYRLRVTIGAGHQWINGNVVNIAGVLGETGANGDYAIREATSSAFVLEDAHGDSVYSSGGVATGPRNSMNGFWTITKINPTQFSLDDSEGVDAGGYVALSANVGKITGQNRTLAQAFMQVANSGTTWRTSMRHTSTATVMVNGSSYVGGDNTGSPVFIYPGQVNQPLVWANGCGVLCEPYFSLGINGLASEARIIGQPWDACLITADYNNESTATFDTHNWLKVTGVTAGGFQNGSLWLVRS